MAKSKILGDDPRTPKLMGVLLLFFATYLFVACFSYIFTWQIDQDKVNHFEFDLIFQDIEVSNWLGRLGAIVSHFLVFWLFGLPSFFIIYILLQYGLGIINGIPLERFSGRLRNSLAWMIGLSVLFGFVFYKSDFPWGGNFGRSISEWLMNFVGTIGTFLLVLLIIAFLIIWSYNPELKGLTLTNFFEQLKSAIFALWDDRYKNKTFDIKENTRRLTEMPSEKKEKTTTSPPSVSLAPMKAGEKSVIEEALAKPEPIAEPEAKEEAQEVEDGEFELNTKNQTTKATSLKVGETELEIEAAPPAAELSDILPTPPVKAVQGELFNEKPYGDISTPYDPTLDLSGYEYPVLPLLDNYEDQKVEIDRSELESNKDQIIETLLNYKIEIVKIRATIGPTVTLYEIVPAPGVRISRIKNLEDDIALSLAALGIRIIAPIPGRGTIGIEVPNKNKQMVSLREMLSSDRFRRSDMDLPIALGKSISNEPIVVDLAKMPHLLIAGATGQGKSVGINTILCSLLYKKHPSQLKLVLIDPKKVELSPYAKIDSHFLAYLPDQLEPIITDTAQVIKTLNSLVIEMESRYDLLKKAQARNIKEYNDKFIARRLNPEKGHKFLPFIVLVVDEFADLIMTAGKEIELPIGRLAQLARAVGIHLIIATQRPSVNIITGVIKANFPARIAFRVSSKVDSRTILDTNGADQLIGRGDMLLTAGSDIIRLQCAFVDTPEVERVINFIHEQPGYPQPYFLPEFTGGDAATNEVGAVDINDLDDMLEDAARLVVQNQHGSTSMIQRRLKLGYNRAGRIMDQLEHLGVVGPNEGSKPREVLFHDEVELQRFLQELRSKRFGN
ncbi:MAG: DNA translocase FtsK 4TM domain-containing protein [Saprospiraceae bacterium]|nr:DNA translocase FtsK 4TM domain-containing protein [Saprospiraceae bacterium]